MLQKHLEEECLELYALRRLQVEEAEEVEDHLFFCEHCRIRLKETEQYVAAFRRAAAKLRNEDATARDWISRLLPVWLAPTPAVGMTAASLLVVVVMGWQALMPAHYGDVSLRTMRSLESPVTASPGHYRLHLDVTGLSPGSSPMVTLVDSNGREILKENGWPVGDREVVATLGRRLGTGTYYVRVATRSEPDRPLREFQLRIE